MGMHLHRIEVGKVVLRQAAYRAEPLAQQVCDRARSAPTPLPDAANRRWRRSVQPADDRAQLRRRRLADVAFHELRHQKIAFEIEIIHRGRRYADRAPMIREGKFLAQRIAGVQTPIVVVRDSSSARHPNGNGTKMADFCSKDDKLQACPDSRNLLDVPIRTAPPQPIDDDRSLRLSIIHCRHERHPAQDSPPVRARPWRRTAPPFPCMPPPDHPRRKRCGWRVRGRRRVGG